MCCRRSSNRKSSALVEELGDTCLAFAADVASEEGVAGAVDFAVKNFGKLDIVFNNAGILGSVGPIKDISSEDGTEPLMFCFPASFLNKARHPVMEGNGGVIINTASTAGVRAGLGPHIYTAAKHGELGCHSQWRRVRP